MPSSERRKHKRARVESSSGQTPKEIYEADAVWRRKYRAWKHSDNYRAELERERAQLMRRKEKLGG